MQYQAEMLAQVLRLAQVKARELVYSAPPEFEHQAVLLQQELIHCLRQALALQQRVLQPQEPLLELPEGALLPQLESLVQLEYQKLLAQVEEQAEVLAPQSVVFQQLEME